MDRPDDPRPLWVFENAYGRRPPTSYSADGPVLVVYGDRYIAIADEPRGRIERVLDLEAYRHPAGAREHIGYPGLRDDVLYVCTDGPSGILSALDAVTGAPRWQTVAGTCNGSFLFADDLLIASYEGGLRVVRRSDGALLQKLTLPRKITTLERSGARIEARADDDAGTAFELR